MRRNLVIRYFLIFLLLFSTSLHAETDVDHAYLGVHTSRLDNGLSYQLGLPKGVHLQVDQVAPGSPAEQAGIRLYDVLLRFDDQLLINPDQLKTLVRMRNPGERISLSILRQSKPISLSVELIEAPESARDSYDHVWNEDRDPFDLHQFFGPNNRFRDFFRRHSFDFPELHDLHRQPFFSKPRLDDPSAVPLPNTGTDGLDDPLHGGVRDVQSHTYSSSTQQITVSDEDGSLQWTEKDGHYFLRATDLEGRVLFEGAITTEADRKKIPAPVLKRLQYLESKGQIPSR